MKEFSFKYQGFRTTYRAVPSDQTYKVFVGNDPITFFEANEMQQMIVAGKVLKVFDNAEEGNDEAA